MVGQTILEANFPVKFNAGFLFFFFLFSFFFSFLFLFFFFSFFSPNFFLQLLSQLVDKIYLF